jgi:hypothetical protein
MADYKLPQKKKTLQVLNNIKYPLIGYIRGDPHLSIPNPTAPFKKNPYKDFFTILMEGGNVQTFLQELNSFGYKSNVFKTISLVAIE